MRARPLALPDSPSPRRLLRLHGVLTLAIVASLGIAPAHAAPAACVDGTWRGTLGGTPVSIELNAAENDRPAVGRYYYRSSLGDLTLVRDAKTGTWQELDAQERPTGQLTLSCEGTALGGEWRSADGTRRLPIVANAVPGEAFNAPRKAGLKPRLDKTGEIGGRRFEELSYAVPGGAGTKGQSIGVVHRGVRLVGTGPGLEALNAVLQAKAVEAAVDHLDCVAQGRRERGPEAGYESSQGQTVLAWNAAFAVISTWTEGYCGGAHPWHGSVVTTYRLDTGAPVDTAAWLVPALRKEIPKTSALGRLLMSAYARTANGPDADCRDEIRWGGYAVHPVAGKLVFEGATSYAMTPCAEDIALPLAVVQPFLTKDGQDALKSFR
ncbi:hypothetical protein [Mitsuaria sp. GD03876]|uniref:hypothetical protein n=1 Tax=Mitsuaria sp. GD03876 TaxID=2975399 RepID=UPI00244D0506|nr:hypothetical protein [Mitsuaria sp. GD03876]MDH0866561.1 hypothetical protein [Mitsuaria sp. GD03876]